MLSIFTALRALFEKLGLWESESSKKKKEVKANIKRYEDRLKSQETKLEELKQTIASTQEEILFKEKELKSQTGKIREIVEKEIGLLFKKFESTTGMRDLIIRNIDGLNTTISKFNELLVALDSDLDSDSLEDLTMDLLDNIKELQAQDRELTRLQSTGYKSKSEESDFDLEARLAQLHGAVSATQTKTEKTSEPVMPKYDMPEKKTMPTDEEVNALEQKLRDLHKSMESAPNTETPSASQSMKLEE